MVDTPSKDLLWYNGVVGWKDKGGMRTQYRPTMVGEGFCRWEGTEGRHGHSARTFYDMGMCLDR